MAVIFSLLATLVSAILAVQVGRQFWKRRHPYQLLWATALLLFAIGAGCQLMAELVGWSSPLYRLWYLTGAILMAAYLGQGTVYLQARRPLAHLIMAILLVASVVATVMVFRAPVDLDQALTSVSVSGQGMPRAVRLLTPFFNIFGTVTLVGGALRSSWHFLWHGGSNQRALGTGLIAAGALIVATGGTLARFSIPEALYITELVGVAVIFAGFLLTNRPSPAPNLSPQKLQQRRYRLTQLGVGAGVTTLLGAMILLPILPWTMDIVTHARHVFIETVPEENKGAYLVTKQGVMQLYTWRVEPSRFPDDAPTLAVDDVLALAVVQKQFAQLQAYRLYRMEDMQPVAWQDSNTQAMQLTLVPETLQPGHYMLVVPTDSMFGGKTWHYFIMAR